MEEDKGSSFRPTQFSGKQEDYVMWAAKFLSYAQVKGFKKVLLGTEVVPHSSTVIIESDKEKLRIRKANDMAYSMLNISVNDDVSFGAIFNAVTEKLPDGDAKMAWDNLKTIFKP